MLHRDGFEQLAWRRGAGHFQQQSFEAGSFQLAPGDHILLYTDGVTEVCDGAASSLEFAPDPGSGTAAMRSRRSQEKIFSTVEQFCGDWEDDATLIVLSVEWARDSESKDSEAT